MVEATYLDNTQAAEYLRISPQTLNKYRITGEGPPFCKLGRRVLYRKQDLDAWVAARRVHSTSEITHPPQRFR